MAFCSKCGKELPEDAKFCTSCGTSVDGSDTPNAGVGTDYKEKAKELMNTPDTTASFDATDIEGNRVMAVLAYLGILVLVPLLAASKSPYARYHTNQGLLLLIASVICSAVSAVPILGWLVALVGNVITFVLMIIGIINAAQGRARQLPLIGKFTLLK